MAFRTCPHKHNNRVEPRQGKLRVVAVVAVVIEIAVWVLVLVMMIMMVMMVMMVNRGTHGCQQAPDDGVKSAKHRSPRGAAIAATATEWVRENARKREAES